MKSIRFVSAEEAGCPILKTLKGSDNYEPYLVHVQQRHIDIHSLPCPSEPLCFPSFPIEISSGRLPFDVKEVANLWLRLLAIQIQNGNFVRYGNLIKERPKVRMPDESNPDHLTEGKEKKRMYSAFRTLFLLLIFFSFLHSPRASERVALTGPFSKRRGLAKLFWVSQDASRRVWRS